MPPSTTSPPEPPRGAVPTSRFLLWSVIGLGAAALAGCDRRPSDPPKPSIQFAAMAVTAGVTSVSDAPESARAAISPASDPPKSPIPRPPEPPASPASR